MRSFQKLDAEAITILVSPYAQITDKNAITEFISLQPASPERSFAGFKILTSYRTSKNFISYILKKYTKRFSRTLDYKKIVFNNRQLWEQKLVY